MVTPRTWKCNWIVVIWQLRTAVCCVALSFIMWAIKRNQRRFPPFLFFLQRVCEANNWLMACSSSVASIISHSFPPLTAQLPPPNARAIQQIHWKFIGNSLKIHWKFIEKSRLPSTGLQLSIHFELIEEKSPKNPPIFQSNVQFDLISIKI